MIFNMQNLHDNILVIHFFNKDLIGSNDFR